MITSGMSAKAVVRQILALDKSGRRVSKYYGVCFDHALGSVEQTAPA
jgi:hypothetical protein